MVSLGYAEKAYPAVGGLEGLMGNVHLSARRG